MLQFFMEKENIRERFLSFQGGERKLSNFIQISEILQRVQMENQLDNPGLIHWMEMIKQHPENYQDLIVRVAGYSDYFINLTLQLQEEIINRTAHESF